MSVATVASHSAAELTFVREDGDLLTLRAPSASRPGHHNHTTYDLTTGEAHCDCRGAECGRRCWHLDHLAAAVALVEECRARVAGLGRGSLYLVGRLAATGTEARDAAMLALARAEWRRREAARREAEAGFAPTLIRRASGDPAAIRERGRRAKVDLYGDAA